MALVVSRQRQPMTIVLIVVAAIRPRCSIYIGTRLLIAVVVFVLGVIWGQNDFTGPVLDVRAATRGAGTEESPPTRRPHGRKHWTGGGSPRGQGSQYLPASQGPAGTLNCRREARAPPGRHVLRRSRCRCLQTSLHHYP